MERNRWETALRCLEVALHPNTSDDEVIAGVNGFRRTAAGIPLRELCARFAGNGGPVGEPAELTEELDRLSQENLDLRRRLEVAESIRTVTFRRVDETEQRLRALDEELTVAQRRADAAERQLADVSSAQAEVVDGLRSELSRLRVALDQAKQGAAQSRPAAGAPMFRDFLAAAHRGSDMPQTFSRHSPMPDRGPENAGVRISGAGYRQPWTA